MKGIPQPWDEKHLATTTRIAFDEAVTALTRAFAASGEPVLFAALADRIEELGGDQSARDAFLGNAVALREAAVLNARGA